MSKVLKKLQALAKGAVSSRFVMAFAAVALLALVGVDAHAAGEFLTADPSTGELTVNATPIAVKLIGLVVGIVVAFLSFKFIRPLWEWLGRMLGGK